MVRISIPLLLCLVVAVPAAERAAAASPRDFTAEVKLLYRVAACGGDEAVPEGYDAGTVTAHCKEVDKSIAGWRKKWLDKAAPFLGELLKGGYPKTVVYPFGGGDLLALLAVYPDATEYTTLSLEGMGDPRAVVGIPAKQLKTRLTKLRKVLVAQLGWAWNTTIQLSSDSSDSGTGALPAILVMTLVAMEAHGYEPLEARFFSLGDKGQIVYLTQADVDADDAAVAAQKGKKKKKGENDVQVGAFTNVEIVFRKRGEASAPKKVFRHIAADLSDKALEQDGRAIAHLAGKGKVSAMTKAASYLLWLGSFSKIRDYLLGNMQVMLSDDTGIPPRFAEPAGFRQECWGEFHGAYFGNGGGKAVQAELVKFWKANSKGKLPFRFGYYDNDGHTHLLYTVKK